LKNKAEAKQKKVFVDSGKIQLAVDFVDRLQSLRHESGREFLEIHSMKLNIDRLARFKLFFKQVEEAQIPDDTDYRVFVWPFLETLLESTTEADYPEGLVSGVRLSARINGNDKGSHEAEDLDIGGVTLSTHTSCLINMVNAYQQKRTGTHPASPSIMNLRASAVSNGGENKVQFNPIDSKTYVFEEMKRPPIFALSCYRGLHRSPIDTLVRRKVLESFLERVADNPELEQGAMLSGKLCNHRDGRYLYIQNLIPFNVVGGKDQLRIPSNEVWRASQEAAKSGEIVCGFIHNHPPVKHAQGMSSVDVDNMYQNYFLPYARSIIVDTAQIQGKTEAVTCSSCPFYNTNCSYAKERNVDHFIPGYAMYGWDANAGLYSMPMLVVE
jgi:hypothetical protein